MDRELEAAIDAVGRSWVFMRAEALGWPSGSCPPRWVLSGEVNKEAIEQLKSYLGRALEKSNGEK